jgi:hypothetical protein
MTHRSWPRLWYPKSYKTVTFTGTVAPNGFGKQLVQNSKLDEDKEDGTAMANAGAALITHYKYQTDSLDTGKFILLHFNGSSHQYPKTIQTSPLLLRSPSQKRTFSGPCSSGWQSTTFSEQS